MRRQILMAFDHRRPVAVARTLLVDGRLFSDVQQHAAQEAAHISGGVP
jgi:hypothetical protein